MEEKFEFKIGISKNIRTKYLEQNRLNIHYNNDNFEMLYTRNELNINPFFNTLTIIYEI